MKKIVQSVLIFTVIVTLSSMVYAQAWRGRGRVKGKVFDQDGNPIEGVVVKLWHVEKASGFEVKTNSKGEWHANFIRGGDWDIDFTKEGYAPKKIRVHLKGMGKNEDIVVKLEKLQAPAIPAELLDQVDKANALYNEGKFQEALAMFQEMVEKNPNVKVLNWNIGNCYFQMGQYNKALEHYMMAEADFPDKTQFWMQVGNTYMMLKNFEKAEEAFNKIGIDKIEDPVALYNLGEVLMAKNLQMAIQALERAVQLKPDFVDALYLLGTAYVGNNQIDKAIQTFQAYLQYDSESQRAQEVKLLIESLTKK